MNDSIDHQSNHSQKKFKTHCTKLLIEEIRKSRGFTLDVVELAIGSDTAAWKMVRSRLLRIFGERGLEARVIEILEN